MNTQDFIRESLRNWIPCKLLYEDNMLLCRWLYTGSKPFTDPFFDETIEMCKRLPEYSNGYRAVTTPEAIIEWSAKIDTVYPAALIFHVSRCGSTLVSQALGMLSNTISLSEVPLFDELLRLPMKGRATDKQARELLDGAVRFYGAKRNGEENRLFIKTDCWHLVFYKQLRAIYPTIPFIIMYREPGAVLESNKRKKGLQGIPEMVEPEVYGFDPGSNFTGHPDTYMAAVLEKFYCSIIEIATDDNHLLLLNYNEGLTVMMEKIATFTHMQLSDEEKAMIAERSLYHAKQPGVPFVENNVGGAYDPVTRKLSALYGQVDKQRQRCFGYDNL